MNLRERRQLARAELLIQLAMSAERWAAELEGTGGSRPFDEWPDDEPLVQLTRRYQLSPEELAHVARAVAGSLETLALHAGYDRTPI